MRTTINLDSDIAQAARKLAQARDQSLGAVISDLARRGLHHAAATGRKTGSNFPVFEVPAGTIPLTIEDVRRDEDS